MNSIANTIPFGDITEDELQDTADDLGVSLNSAYQLVQQPVAHPDSDLAVNPRKPGIATEYAKRPSEKLIVLGEGARQMQTRVANAIIPAGQLASGNASIASATDILETKRAIAKIYQSVKKRFESFSEEEWDLFERWRAFNIALRAVKKGLVPSASEMEKRPYSVRTSAFKESSWYQYSKKLANWLDDTRKKPPFTLFTKGSLKLPFYQWSTLPGATCPGAGLCWDKSPNPVQLNANGEPWRLQHNVPKEFGYCYSLNAWRNAGSYLRQVQNTILMRLEDKSHIERALLSIAKASKKQVEQEGKPRIVVRLYVDGDFDSLNTLEYWMHACERHSDPRTGLVFYGYSKSWDLFVRWDEKHGGAWPENYALNLSGGSVYEKAGKDVEMRWIDRMMGLKCTRGRFVAIHGVKSEMPGMTEEEAKAGIDPRSKPGWIEHMVEVKRVAAEKYGMANVFPCPGKCYACGGPKWTGEDIEKRESIYGRHVCGMMAARGKTVAIAIH